MNSKIVAKVITFAVSIALIAGATLLVFQRQFVVDQLTVWTYEPTQQIQSITDRTAFTSHGTFIFYATTPTVATQETFNQGCPRQEVGSPILGCFTGEGKIYIYDITNDQLEGMEEVTAAHEMLHAVWVRLGQAERDSLSLELTAAYESLNDPDLDERMAYYERTEPGETINELHSILGTEVRGLSSTLETHYARYFERAVVLGFHDSYDSVYDQLYGRADELYGLMNMLSASITSRLSAYNADSAQLSAEIASFNTRAQTGDFATLSQFNAERAVLLSRSSALEAERAAINSDIATYNDYHKEYENISEQIDVLNQSIDSFTSIDDSPSL